MYLQSILKLLVGKTVTLYDGEYWASDYLLQHWINPKPEDEFIFMVHNTEFATDDVAQLIISEYDIKIVLKQ